MGPDGRHLNLCLTLLDAESHQGMIYIFSILYLYVRRGRRSSLVANCFQVLAKNSKPAPRTKRYQAFACATGLHRVKTLPVLLWNVDAPHRQHRFTALSGMYFSLQYLSFSDAVVLRYIAPILTGFSGAIFLRERLFLKQFVAGCKHDFMVELTSTAILQDASVQPLGSGADCQASVSFW
jgi:hypothetical protein